jgi:hypothetical protein
MLFVTAQACLDLPTSFPRKFYPLLNTWHRHWRLTGHSLSGSVMYCTFPTAFQLYNIPFDLYYTKLVEASLITVVRPQKEAAVLFRESIAS